MACASPEDVEETHAFIHIILLCELFFFKIMLTAYSFTIYYLGMCARFTPLDISVTILLLNMDAR